MKNFTKPFLVMCAAGMLAVACSGTPPPVEETPSESQPQSQSEPALQQEPPPQPLPEQTPPPLRFEDAVGQTWFLVEVSGENGAQPIDRAALKAAEQADSFSLTFNADGMLSGKAAPNTYGAPYTLGDDQALSIAPARTTLMMGLNQPDVGITEQQYYGYLAQVSRWELTDGQLSLHTGGAVLRFIL
jgi:heat shock protein HslJ